jgi:hypothetical protein
MSRLRIPLDFPSLRRVFAPAIPAFLIAIGCGSVCRRRRSWNAVGPAGGDARAFGAVPGEPNHLYLGTTNSWIYESVDEGASWRRLAKLDPAEDLVVYKILVDASNPAVVLRGDGSPTSRTAAFG